MTVFVVNVGSTLYSEYSLPIIEKLCEYNNVNLYVLDKDIPQNIYNVHPSWLKLFCFDLIDDDFVITWDLDLIPTELYNFKKYFNQKKINLSYDPSFVNENFTFNGKFKYNCGLMGIPSIYGDQLKKLYIEKAQNSQYPSYEQYHVNDKIHDENIDINLLDYNLNFLYNGIDNFKSNIKNVHYTWKINSNEHRAELVNKHYNKYKKNFKL